MANASQGIHIKQDTRVLIFGVGRHGGGKSVIEYCKKKKAQIRVTDKASKQELAKIFPTLRSLHGTYKGWDKADVTWADVVVKNPAVPQQHPLLLYARKKHIPVVSDVEIFFNELGRLPDVAVTGTRGKSTTTALIGSILSQRKQVNVIGNIRIAPLSTLPQRAQTLQVAELSSFQIDDLPDTFHPHVGVFTNVYPDHLNRYSSFARYIASKKRLFLNQGKTDYTILNYDSPKLKSFASRLHTQIFYFSLKPLPQKVSGAFFYHDRFYFQNRGKRPQQVCERADLRLLGMHNIANVAAAITAAKVFHIPNSSIKTALSRFNGLPGRQQQIAVKRGIFFINDTTSTTPVALLAAIRTIHDAHPQATLHVIVGGADKRLRFGVLRSFPKQFVALYGLRGDATQRMKRVVGPFPTYASLGAAFRQALRNAKKGDCVVLSPGAASFNMFIHEFERGDAFTSLVKSL